MLDCSPPDRRTAILFASGLMVVFLWLSATQVPAQAPPAADLNIAQEFGVPPGFGDPNQRPVEFSASWQLAAGTSTGRLQVRAVMQPQWHVYSLTDATPTRIQVQEPAGLQLLSGFRANQEADTREVPEFPGRTFEEHYDEVTWSAPFQLPVGADATQLKILVRIDGQVCRDDIGCQPVGETVLALFAGTFEPQAPAGRYGGEETKVVVRGHWEPQVVPPGSKAKLVLTAEPLSPWHVYPLGTGDRAGANKPTLVAVQPPAGWQAARPVTTDTPVEKVVENELVAYYDRPVTWTVEVAVPADAKPGDYDVSGVLAYQVCTETNCLAPAGVQFDVRVKVGDAAAGERPLTWTKSSYSKAAKLLSASPAGGGAEAPAPGGAGTPPPADGGRGSGAAGLNLDRLNVAQAAGQETTFLAAMALAFLGGFILNFMPCVLPVIGLKIMAFVQQAGQHRSRILILNIWYALGLLSVFMVLATLAVVWNFGWGQQSQFATFNITMAAVVFVMGLSFVGVWEIPIPGFVGTGAASELAEREGLPAAFVKGCITTILAVPCSGPGLATALAWCTGKQPVLVYAVFFMMGLGMASPYLVIGLNPKLIRFLPKPGAWMETFKELMGFVLLGTVVWIMSYIEWHLLLPTIACLIGLWAACWLIGRTPAYAETPVKVRSWLAATTFSLVVGLFSFLVLAPIMQQRFQETVDQQITERRLQGGAAAGDVPPPAGEVAGSELAWQVFSTQRLIDETAKGNTVLVDFTADW